MKKLIYLLLLISGGLSAQVVIPKSTTTFSNVNAVGSMTVGGNLRVTGSETITGSTTLTGAVTTATNVTVGGKLSAASLSVTAQTFSVGTTNYTAGNTGTVAVLSNVYALYPFLGGSINPTDGQTFYCGTLKYVMSSNRTGGFYIPYNATIVGWTSTNIVSGLGSNETYSLQCWQNNTTATNLSTSITSAAVVNTFSGTANVSVTAGDYIETRFIAPTWVTNPTGIEASVSLLISPR